ncbi:RNA polymerase sigma factor [Paremcibacter congregatus]|uniref:RNA polymerase sigma factor n=1 Tax=Paremcibacter congregatus TaxID=2043170 RepID=UPI0030EF1C89|tara:strand:+ start:157 stop:714 length:558 start_codon:yes stop_codon:yes gene_type:complete
MTKDNPDKPGNTTIGKDKKNNNKQQTVDQIARSRVNELRAFIYKYLRDRDLAEELAQESLMRLINRMKKPGVNDTGAYLFRTATNVIRDHFRRQKASPIDPHVDWETIQVTSQDPTPEEVLHCGDLQEAWKLALCNLPTIQQEIFYLRRIEKMSTLDIATRYQLTQRSVQRHLAVVFKSLHDSII